MAIRLICKGCGCRVDGTIGGFCMTCLDENVTIVALEKAVDRMKQMVKDRRDTERLAQEQAV